MALSVEKVRHEMLRGILIPREMVNKALVKTYEQLEAKETKFFSFKGHVVEKREVEDHATQAAAADKIFSLAGLYARERESRNATPGVALEVDPHTGVVRILVGDTMPALAEAPMTIDLPPSEALPAEVPVVNHAHDAEPAAADASKPRRVAVSPAVWNILSDEIVE